MKHKLFILLALISFSPLLNGQGWSEATKLWSTDSIHLTQITDDLDASTIVLGYFQDTLYADAELLVSRGFKDYYFAKFDSLGQMAFINSIGGVGNEFAFGGIGADALGNIYVTGAFRNTAFFTPSDSLESNGNYDVFLAKYDTDGGLTWAKNIGTGQRAQRSNTLAISPLGKVLLAGDFSDSIYMDASTTLYADNNVKDVFYAQFDADGNLEWAKQIKTVNNPTGAAVHSIFPSVADYTMTMVYSDSAMIADDTLVSMKDYDVGIVRTDLDGDVQWIRSVATVGDITIGGNVYSYALDEDPDNNMYLAGYYATGDTLWVDSTGTDKTFRVPKGESLDMFVAKYDQAGTLQWVRTNGGLRQDKLLDIQYFDGEVHVVGAFTGSIQWGTTLVEAQGTINDQDYFIGTLTSEGNYVSGGATGGINNSREEGFSLNFTAKQKRYSVLLSNSEVLDLVEGAPPITSFSGRNYVVLGVSSCLPISIDDIDPRDIDGCFGDSTGSIQIFPSGGFGAPWKYSIHPDSLSVLDKNFWPDLPAGNYLISVTDSKNCTKTADSETVLSQPEVVAVQTISLVDSVIVDSLGNVEEFAEWVTSATGGSELYTFTLQPNDLQQTLGTFNISESGTYHVEVVDSKGCGPVSTDTVDISVFILGILQNGQLLDANIYPNPSRSYVTIELDMDADEVQMEVLSLTGQIVHRSVVHPSAGVLHETLDVSGLAQGMYMLRLNGRSVNTRIIVQ